MANCTECGTMILFGGVKIDGRHYCNHKCASSESAHADASHVPLEKVHRQMLEVFDGNCPLCHGPGPVDVRESHFAFSALIVCRTWSTRQISCFGCGRREQIKAALVKGLAGWFSFPGLVLTPIQLYRNIAAATRPQPTTIPSTELEKIIRYEISRTTILIDPAVERELDAMSRSSQ